MELSAHQHQFESLGIHVVAMTYESADTNAAFTRKHDIGFVILTDENSEYFRTLGIFNEQVPPDHRFYGIPHPGIMLVDRDGVVVAKFAEADYRQRPAIEDVLTATGSLLADEQISVEQGPGLFE